MKLDAIWSMINKSYYDSSKSKKIERAAELFETLGIKYMEKTEKDSDDGKPTWNGEYILIPYNESSTESSDLRWSAHEVSHHIMAMLHDLTSHENYGLGNDPSNSKEKPIKPNNLVEDIVDNIEFACCLLDLWILYRIDREDLINEHIKEYNILVIPDRETEKQLSKNIGDILTTDIFTFVEQKIKDYLKINEKG